MKTFTKEPKLAKRMRKLKSTPVWYYQKESTGRIFATRSLLCFRYFAARQYISGCFSIGRYVIDSLLRAKSTLRQECKVYVLLQKKRLCLWFSSFPIVKFCLHAWQLIAQFSVQNDWRRRHILNMNSYSMSNNSLKTFEVTGI